MIKPLEQLFFIVLGKRQCSSGVLGDPTFKGCNMKS